MKKKLVFYLSWSNVNFFFPKNTWQAPLGLIGKNVPRPTLLSQQPTTLTHFRFPLSEGSACGFSQKFSLFSLIDYFNFAGGGGVQRTGEQDEKKWGEIMQLFEVELKVFLFWLTIYADEYSVKAWICEQKEDRFVSLKRKKEKRHFLLLKYFWIDLLRFSRKLLFL